MINRDDVARLETPYRFDTDSSRLFVEPVIFLLTSIGIHD